MAFCGAPASIGIGGCVNRARPAQPGPVPGVGRHLEHVVAGHAVAAERVAQPLDPVPVQLETGAHHQGVVADASPSSSTICARARSGDRRLQPAQALGHHLGHGALRRAIEHAAADQGPARLVVVRVARLDEGDRDAGPALEEPAAVEMPPAPPPTMTTSKVTGLGGRPPAQGTGARPVRGAAAAPRGRSPRRRGAQDRRRIEVPGLAQRRVVDWVPCGRRPGRGPAARPAPRQSGSRRRRSPARRRPGCAGNRGRVLRPRRPEPPRWPASSPSGRLLTTDWKPWRRGCRGPPR